MSLSTIRTELLNKLDAVVGVPPIKDEDENFKPATSKDYPFARVTLMPAESKQQDLNSGKQTIKGLLRIDLFSTRSLNTTAVSRAVAESIVDSIRPATQTILSDCALTIEASWIEATRYDGTAANIPVYIRWSAMTL